MATDEVRSDIARLLTGRCNNCYSRLPGPVGCNVHSEGWHWLTPNFGPFCDECWKEVVGPHIREEYVAVDGIISQREERLSKFDFIAHFIRQKYEEIRRHAPEGDLNFRLWVYR